MKRATLLRLAHVLFALACALASHGCEERLTPPSSAPDNTARNARDTSGATTPTDQGNSESDRRITADIRKAIVGDSALSVDAQNCKVVTKNGVVTLRGPVKTQAEKDTIATIARSVAGVASVINELEVKA